MILRNATIQYKGYNPDDLSKGSNKRICVSCDQCGRVKYSSKNAYRDLCKLCSNKIKNRKNKEKIINQFIKENTNKHICQCGCKKFIKIKRHHYNSKIPKYIHGHNEIIYIIKKGKNNPNYNFKIDQFVKDNQGKHFCKCGCCEEIVIKRDHYSTGIPKYIHGHNMKTKDHWNWKCGLSFEIYPKEFNNQLKKLIRIKYNNCDYISGIHKNICNPYRKLDIHHINYDKKNCDENNLIPLSRSNHTKTGINRQFWNRLFIYALEYDRWYYGDDI